MDDVYHGLSFLTVHGHALARILKARGEHDLAGIRG